MESEGVGIDEKLGELVLPVFFVRYGSRPGKPAEFIGDNSESGARKASSDRHSNLEVVRREDVKPDEADGRKKSNGRSLTILETDNEVKEEV